MKSSASETPQSPCHGAELVGPLVSQHAAKLTLYARQLCDDAEDAVQQAFIDLATSDQPPDDPLAWLFRCVRNKALTAARSRSRRRKYEQAAAKERSVWFREATAENLDAAEVTQKLELLEPTQRELIVAHLWGGLTFRQVAALMGISHSTAFRQYEAALSALRERMSEQCTTSN